MNYQGMARIQSSNSATLTSVDGTEEEKGIWQALHLKEDELDALMHALDGALASLVVHGFEGDQGCLPRLQSPGYAALP